jgi:predicted nuclease of predicted toxin-antitoxin system
VKIKIYTDENVNGAIVNGLRRRGVEVQSAHEAGNLGITDEEQLAYAVVQHACLFTHDDDLLTIADHWQHIGKEYFGIIFVHQEKLSIGEIIRSIKLIVDILSPEEIKNHIEFL